MSAYERFLNREKLWPKEPKRPRHPRMNDYIKFVNDSKPTEYEDIFAEYLREWGVNHIRSKGFLNKKSFYIVDFYLPQKYIVEIDGGYHKTRKKYDAERDRSFLLGGITTIRITNEQVLDKEFCRRKMYEITKWNAFKCC